MDDRFVSPPGHEPHKHNYKPPHCWACDISWPCPAVLTATIDAVHAENARLREQAKGLTEALEAIIADGPLCSAEDAELCHFCEGTEAHGHAGGCAWVLGRTVLRAYKEVNHG